VFDPAFALYEHRSFHDPQAVLKDEPDEGAAIQAKRQTSSLHLFEDIEVKADALCDGRERSVIVGHICAD
jgi:hypothetical protein